MTPPVALGIDIGGTRLRAALVSRSGAVLARKEVLTLAQAGPEAVVAQVAELAAIVAGGIPHSDIAGAGISAPGPIDTVRGVALGVPTLKGWSGVPVAAMTADALKMPVRLENDAIAAANGEWRFGAGRGLANLVYVTVSTGVGGGAVVDGNLLRGRMGLAGHVGHMVVMRDGALCSCGNRGCWEAYASGTAFARRIAERLAREGATGLHADASPADVFRAARGGDAVAAELVAEHGDYLGLGIVGLLHLFSPDAVILGGGVSNGFDLLLPAMKWRVDAGAMPAFREAALLPAGLGENSGLVGAAALLFESAGA